jgi:hypothetical protein
VVLALVMMLAVMFVMLLSVMSFVMVAFHGSAPSERVKRSPADPLGGIESIESSGAELGCRRRFL